MHLPFPFLSSLTAFDKVVERFEKKKKIDDMLSSCAVVDVLDGSYQGVCACVRICFDAFVCVCCLPHTSVVGVREG